MADIMILIHGIPGPNLVWYKEKRSRTASYETRKEVGLLSDESSYSVLLEDKKFSRA